MTTTFAVLGAPEVIGILVIILVLFGAKKLPELAKGLGQGIKEFKKATNEVTSDLQKALDEEPTPAPQAKAEPAPSDASADEKPAEESPKA